MQPRVVSGGPQLHTGLKDVRHSAVRDVHRPIHSAVLGERGVKARPLGGLKHHTLGHRTARLALRKGCVRRNYG
jgi:hypothetical protein